MNAKSSHSGFTLPELLVTLILVGVLAGVAMARLDFGGANAAGAASLLEVRLWGVKQIAMTHLIRAGLRFDESARVYTAVAIPSENGGADPFEADPIRETISADFIETTFPGGELFFDAMGRPVTGAGALMQTPQRITIHDGDRVFEIVVEPITGWIHQ
ncbi:MAG: prepilin-type N-terminal cleavage/methylation domain-containing protein [bacterium]|nr:prepilin-type N-terminal cleavage/methylation domain-containing protein [bacterium]